MICITWYEPAGDECEEELHEYHYCCDALGAYEYDELLWLIKANNYDYDIDYDYNIEING